MKKIVSIVLASIMLLGLVGCIEIPEREVKTTEQASKANEQAVNKLIKEDDLPQITRSLERENIKRRIEFINQPDGVGYLYLISENGQLIREIQVLGKVSSMNSYLTPMEELTYGSVEGYRGELFVAESADLDGTWGERVEGIFWFDLDGVYGEWNGLYQYSSQRLSFTSQPLLIESIK
ncbi:MAG: hypothetical protein K0R54_1808 [Clostridiaceae bacterium]|jgi:hypothetical protein|nr:hypothetical protein [Clostridiaceae bacterium]